MRFPRKVCKQWIQHYRTEAHVRCLTTAPFDFHCSFFSLVACHNGVRPFLLFSSNVFSSSWDCSTATQSNSIKCSNPARRNMFRNMYAQMRLKSFTNQFLPKKELYIEKPQWIKMHDVSPLNFYWHLVARLKFWCRCHAQRHVKVAEKHSKVRTAHDISTISFVTRHAPKHWLIVFVDLFS